MIEEKQATSPVIMSYRRADADGRIKEVKQLIQEMYADKPTWLQLSGCGSSAHEAVRLRYG